MKAEDIRSLSAEEIAQRIDEEEEQLGRLRFEHTIKGVLENPLILREKRRTVARLKTILNEKKRAAAA